MKLSLTVLFEIVAAVSAYAAGSAWPITQQAAATEWSVALDRNIAWKITLPESGQNTPVIHGGRVFLSTNKEVTGDAKLGADIVAWCCDAATGKVLWKQEIPGRYPLRLSGCFSDSTSPPAVCDGERVVFLNAAGTVACFDLDGKPLWKKEILSVGRSLPFLSGGKYVFTLQVYPPEDGEFSHKHAEAPLAEWTQLQALDIKTGDVAWTTTCGLNMGCAVIPQKLGDGREVAGFGRGGGHGPPEKPEGVSMVDLRDGKTLWSLDLPGFMATMSFGVRNDELQIFHGSEHLSVNALIGKIVRRVNFCDNVAVRRRKDGHWVTETESIKGKGARMITQTSDLLVGPYHYFRSYTRPCLGRVNVETGAVEYLELPLQLGRAPGREDTLLWFTEPQGKGAPSLVQQTIVPNEVKNSRGFVVMGDKRSTGSGWGHIASPTPCVAGPNLYVPVMNGTVYVINWNAPKLDEKAIVAINDLGPAGQAYTRASLAFAGGRVFAHTIRELICIGK